LSIDDRHHKGIPNK